MTGIKIAGTGAFAPELVVDNDDFTKFLDTSDEWIRTRTGMQQRHIATNEPTWYMGAQAARQALEAARCDPLDIELILCTTVSGEYVTPSTGCLIQGEIGADNAFALDLNVACTGLAFSLDMARRYLATGMKKILVVGAETMSQVTNYEDRATCVLLGDGAGAVVVEPGEGLYGSFCRSDASGVKHLYCKRTRRTHPFLPQVQGEEENPLEWLTPLWHDGLYMNGREVYKFATRAMPEAIQRACQAAGVAVEDLNLIIPHQANLRIIETAMKNLGLPMEKTHINIHLYGNTSSATMVMGLHECVQEGKIHSGDLVCLVGMGAGLTYGACVFTY